MDIVCICCGESWSTDYVLHEEPEGFVRSGGVIHACPCCKGVKQNLPDAKRQRLDEICALAELLGGDIDGLQLLLRTLVWCK